jgi:hypothetical protein
VSDKLGTAGPDAFAGLGQGNDGARARSIAVMVWATEGMLTVIGRPLKSEQDSIHRTRWPTNSVNGGTSTNYKVP